MKWIMSVSTSMYISDISPADQRCITATYLDRNFEDVPINANMMARVDFIMEWENLCH